MLEQEYGDELSVEKAQSVAAKAIQSAVERDVASGNGINMCVVDEEGVEITQQKELETFL